MNVYVFCGSMDGTTPEQYRDCRMINLSDPNDFRYTIKHQLKSLPDVISPEAADLLYLSMFVFAVDRRLSRELGSDGWSRRIHLIVPVLYKEKWDTQIPLVVDMLNFLSGDVWSLEFYKRQPVDYETRTEEYFAQQRIENPKIATICMLSGGLDSFIGAIDLLTETQDVYFVSHAGGGKGVKAYQNVLIENIAEEYKIDRIQFYQFYAAKIGGVEDTTRTRSFMFFSHAIAVASCLQRHMKLIVPENGFISLNIPLTHSRLGSSSTRTTHPYYMSLFQQLIYNLEIDVTIHNPYQFKTKGEMIIECKNQEFMKDNLGATMSCSHPDEGRHRKEPPCHCGICLPCMVRRAAILRADIADPSNYRDWDFTKTPTAKINLNTYKVAIRKINPKYAFLKIQNSGPIVSNIDQYAALYVRGMEELAAVLEEIHAI